MSELVITLDFTDESDMDYIRVRAVGAVEDVVEEAGVNGDDRLDGDVDVSWEINDDS